MKNSLLQKIVDNRKLILLTVRLRRDIFPKKYLNREETALTEKELLNEIKNHVKSWIVAAQGEGYIQYATKHKRDVLGNFYNLAKIVHPKISRKKLIEAIYDEYLQSQ